MGKFTEKFNLKLSIDKITYGIVPFGADAGNRTLAIYFKAANGEAEVPKREDLKMVTEDEKDKALSDVDLVAYRMVEDLFKMAEDAHLKKNLENYLLAKEQCYFVGDALAQDEFRKYSMALFEKLSRISKRMQLDVIQKIAKAEKLDEKSTIMRYISAPYTIFAGTATNYTGVDLFYENFNFVVVKLNLKSPAPIAFMEVQNHKFVSYIIPATSDTIDEIESDLKKNYDGPGLIKDLPQKFFFVDYSNSERVAEAADARRWRIQRPLEYEDALKLFD